MRIPYSLKELNKRHIAILLAGVGIVAVLCIPILATPTELLPGETAHQEWWIGRMSILFFCCNLLACCLNRKIHLSFPTIITWALIVTGGIEALWGLKQVYGLTVSNHSLYSLTGSFFNPGPYSGYLAMVLPLSLREWLSFKGKTERTWLEQLQYYMAGIVLLLILCVLPAGMSRSAWLASGVSGMWVYGIHASLGVRLKEVRYQYGKRLIAGILIGSIVSVGIIGTALFQIKASSANGRLLMWKICTLAIAERPVSGHGAGSFPAVYGMMQEQYFAEGDYSETEERVAGSPEYAFNEYLQIAVEHGAFILILMIAILIYALRQGMKERRIGICGSIISVSVFALSSYPMQIPGFALTFCFLIAACMVGRSRLIWLLFIIFVASVGVYNWKNNRHTACKEWYRTKMLYNIGAYRSAKEGYENLYPELRNKGAFLFEYGHCLHKLRDFTQSITLLEEAATYSNDPMILNVIGKNYQEMGVYEQAEKYLIRSTHRLPGRIYPYYLLAKLYAEPIFYKPEKLRQAVETVLTKEPKVPSTAVREMRREVGKWSDTIKRSK